jgi:RNA polymerase sigma-70 factor, ECF subfamily
MEQQLQLIELVEKAKHGDRQSLSQLAEQAKDRLQVYVYRLTQQQELTGEIVQESLVEMFKVIGKLRESDRFWPWLYGIATNKLHRHYRTEQKQRRFATSDIPEQLTFKDRQSGFEKLVGDELKQIVAKAMNQLKTRYKAVLVMRCYDDMAYSEIAESIGSSEFGTRMLFVRAKKALQKELSRNGFGRGSLIAALIVFGKMTAPSKAAAAQITVTSATLKVGILAGIAGVATTNTAVVSMVTAGALTAGTLTMTSNPWLHNNESSTVSSYLDKLEQSGDTKRQYMFFFPQGPAGAMMLRATTGDEGQTPMQILQNDQANYYYDNSSVVINNYRMFNKDLSVMKIPTDDIKMTNFISNTESSTADIEHITASGKGLLVIASRSGGRDSAKPWAIKQYNNVLEEDYFQVNFPVNTSVVDNRDQMHKRGWTYFTVTGRINNQTVSGSGRMPFVYQTSTQNSPWLKMQVGNITIIDTEGQAYVSDSSGGSLSRYKAGSFFQGLSRPWMGLHTLDTVRRDAALQGIQFQTKQMQDARYVEVVLSCDNLKLVYKIDMEKDVVDEINFSNNHGDIGNLKFSYLQSIEKANGQFEIPSRPAGGTSVLKSEPGLLWLTHLSDGTL